VVSRDDEVADDEVRRVDGAGGCDCGRVLEEDVAAMGAGGGSVSTMVWCSKLCSGRVVCAGVPSLGFGRTMAGAVTGLRLSTPMSGVGDGWGADGGSICELDGWFGSAVSPVLVDVRTTFINGVGREFDRGASVSTVFAQYSNSSSRQSSSFASASNSSEILSPEVRARRM
jgi:hypothetical protein